MRIDEYSFWPLLKWVRYMASIQLVRVFAGSLFKATLGSDLYLRLNGARLGHGVYINSLAVSDHNLLEFGDHLVIGDGAHLSGHTVERGMLKTARVRLGSGVTVGLGTFVGIGVTAGDGCQIGALSLVPKFSQLEAKPSMRVFRRAGSSRIAPTITARPSCGAPECSGSTDGRDDSRCDGLGAVHAAAGAVRGGAHRGGAALAAEVQPRSLRVRPSPSRPCRRGRRIFCIGSRGRFLAR